MPKDENYHSSAAGWSMYKNNILLKRTERQGRRNDNGTRPLFCGCSGKEDVAGVLIWIFSEIT